jgi:hypothetical protein
MPPARTPHRGSAVGRLTRAGTGTWSAGESRWDRGRQPALLRYPQRSRASLSATKRCAFLGLGPSVRLTLPLVGRAPAAGVENLTTRGGGACLRDDACGVGSGRHPSTRIRRRFARRAPLAAPLFIRRTGGAKIDVNAWHRSSTPSSLRSTATSRTPAVGLRGLVLADGPVALPSVVHEPTPASALPAVELLLDERSTSAASAGSVGSAPESKRRHRADYPPRLEIPISLESLPSR